MSHLQSRERGAERQGERLEEQSGISTAWVAQYKSDPTCPLLGHSTEPLPCSHFHAHVPRALLPLFSTRWPGRAHTPHTVRPTYWLMTAKSLLQSRSLLRTPASGQLPTWCLLSNIPQTPLLHEPNLNNLFLPSVLSPIFQALQPEH